MWNKAIKKQLLRKKKQYVTQLKNAWEEDFFYTNTISTFVYQQWVKLEQALVPLRRRVLDLSVLALVLVVGGYIFFPTIANADVEQAEMDRTSVQLVIDAMQNETTPHGRLPPSEDADPRRIFTVPITAYTSEVGQTDSTPCITASGLDVCARDTENVVAANFLPLGTRVRIPELYGDRVFFVEDRMNARYQYKMDIWMKEKSAAKTFGVKYTTVEVF